MKYPILIFSLLLALFTNAQVDCGEDALFEEKDGLLVIEMENTPLHSDWKLEKKKDGYTGDGYIYWSGQQYLWNIGNKELHYNIKINTPGTYKLTWRMAVGRGTMVSDHNDTWLKIEADDFYGKKSNHIVKPKPQCESDPNADCPNGATLNGFFKVWGQSTNFIWASFTSDHDAHEIFATFDEPGTYKITLDARSSFCFLDRMVLRLNTVSDNLALSTSTPSSSCTVATNTAKIEAPNKLKIYPNPVQDIFQIENLPKQQGILLIKNIQGMTLRKIDLQSSQATIDTYGLEQGVYYLVYQGKTTLKTQKFLKM